MSKKGSPTERLQSENELAADPVPGGFWTTGRDKGRGKPLPLGIEGMIYQGLKGFRDQRDEGLK